MFTKKNLFVILLNLVIAIGFYVEHKDSGYSVLVSDVYSIVPIAQKFDNPELFKNDLYLNTLDNVKYYTPFFVQPLRFIAKFTNHDYLQALNVFGLISHFIFGLLWYLLLFKFTRSFWVSLMVSILMRGIVWLPGFEIWGITDVWSIMPRTIYITFMPIPFLIISELSKLRLLIASFFIGLVFNFHPITGLGGILIFLTLVTSYYYFYKQKVNISLKVVPFIFLAIVLGMIPFMITYFTKTGVVADYDLELYKKAFLKRIPAHFLNPLTYLKQWYTLKTLFFVAPMIAYLVISTKSKTDFIRARTLIILSFSLLFFSSISIYIENLVNHLFNLNIRMAFQFIRLQKLAILPAYFAMAYLLLKLKAYKFFLPSIFIVFIFLLTISKASVFKRTPLLGDAIFQSILPNKLSIVKNNKQKFIVIDEMMIYIKENTDQDAVFLGPPVIRSAANRSVVLDYKGASAIIEGNPKQFIQWYLDRIEFEDLITEAKRIEFLKTKKVDYILTRNEIKTEVVLIHQIDSLKLYKIK